MRAQLTVTFIAASAVFAPAVAADGPDMIFRESTRWPALTPNDKLATSAVDDPAVDGAPIRTS